MNKRSLRPDGWLLAYAVIALAALALTSVGAYEFFEKLLGPYLAPLATVVISAGVPILKLSAHYDRDQARARTLTIWMLLLLGVELLAQYFKAQAGFAPAVRARPDLAGSDLAAAAASWWASRILAFVFLASLPLVVVAAFDALARRWDTLRARRARGGLRGWLRYFAPRRARFARLRARLADARGAVALQHAQLVTEQRALAETRATLAERDQQLAAAARVVAQLRSDLAAERGRPVLSLENAARVLLEAGAPEATIRGWLTSGRLKLADTRELIEGD